MLASESAWRILMAEHVRIREYLADIARLSASDEWRRTGPELDTLKGLLESLLAFEAGTHRPKGVTLLGALRSRSVEPAVAEMLDAHEKQQADCDRLLGEAIVLLDDLARGRAGAAAEGAERLAQHRALMRAHLAREDTALRTAAFKLLTPEDWSAVVSSMSKVLRQGGQR